MPSQGDYLHKAVSVLMWKGITPSNTLYKTTCKLLGCAIYLGLALICEVEHVVALMDLNGVPHLPDEYLGSRLLESKHASHAKPECKTQHDHTDLDLIGH